MSTSDSSIKGKFDEFAGKAKQAFGDATGDESAANKGAAQEVKGHGEQAWGSVKEAAHDSSDRTATDTHSEAHSLRDKITTGAENLKDRIAHATDDFKKK